MILCAYAIRPGLKVAVWTETPEPPQIVNGVLASPKAATRSAKTAGMVIGMRRAAAMGAALLVQEEEW